MLKHFSGIAAVLLSTTAAFAAAHGDSTVTVVLSEELDIVDPCEASRSNVGRVVLQNVAETMTELVPGSGLQPRLAESWEDMGDGTWRFHLKEGVSFHDGTAFGATDVAHSLARVKSENISCEIGAKFFGGITITTEVVDDTTIDTVAPGVSDSSIPDPSPDTTIMDDTSSTTSGCSQVTTMLIRSASSTIFSYDARNPPSSHPAAW